VVAPEERISVNLALLQVFQIGDLFDEPILRDKIADFAKFANRLNAHFAPECLQRLLRWRIPAGELSVLDHPRQ